MRQLGEVVVQRVRGVAPFRAQLDRLRQLKRRRTSGDISGGLTRDISSCLSRDIFCGLSRDIFGGLSGDISGGLSGDILGGL